MEFENIPYAKISFNASVSEVPKIDGFSAFILKIPPLNKKKCQVIIPDTAKFSILMKIYHIDFSKKRQKTSTSFLWSKTFCSNGKRIGKKCK